MTGDALIGLVMLIVMLGAIFIGFPISFTLLFLALAFGYYALGEVVFSLAYFQTIGMMKEELFAAVPLFIAARVRAARACAVLRVDGDAVGMARELVPLGPAVHVVSAALELAQRGFRKSSFYIEEVARLAEREAAREPARRCDGLCDIEAEVDHVNVALQMDLRLAVGPHAAEHVAELNKG